MAKLFANSGDTDQILHYFRYVRQCDWDIPREKMAKPFDLIRHRNIAYNYHVTEYENKSYTATRFYLLCCLPSSSSSSSELIVITLTDGLGVSAITIVWRWSRLDPDHFTVGNVSAQDAGTTVVSRTTCSLCGGVLSFTRFFTGDSCVEAGSFVTLQ